MKLENKDNKQKATSRWRIRQHEAGRRRRGSRQKHEIGERQWEAGDRKHDLGKKHKI